MVISEAGLRRYLPAETFQPLVWLGLFFAFSALPVALVYATRSSPLFLALSCLALLCDEWRRNARLDRLRALLPGSLRKPIFVPLLLLVALAMASSLWSLAPAHSFRTALQLAGAVLIGIGWVALVSRFRREHVLPFLAGGMTIAVVVLPSELLLSSGVRGFFTGSLMAFEHNRTIVQLSLLATLFAALASLDGSLLWRRWAAALVAALLLLMPMSESQAVFVYWLGAGLAAVAAGWAPRLVLTLAAVGAGIVLLAFPWIVLLGSEAATLFLLSLLPPGFAAAANVGDRLLIWSEFARVVLERPWLGWGIQAERALDLLVVPGGDLRAFTALHPHSFALELWTGLGAAGVALAIVVLFDFWRLTMRYRDTRLAWATCLFVGLFAVWLVSHGAFEHWWLVMLPLTLGTLLALDFYPQSGPPIAPS